MICTCDITFKAVRCANDEMAGSGTRPIEPNNVKRLVTKSGNRLHLSDKPGQETVFLATPNHTSLSMTEHSDETGRQLVHLHSDGDIVLSAGGRVHIQSQFFSREIGSPGKASAAPAVVLR